MSDVGQIDREAVLAATEPAALFGEAVAEPRALKRAYAALVKRFGPEGDPEAFEHIRRLYEAARDGAEPAPPQPEAPPPQPEVVPEPPTARLRAAVTARDWQVVVDTVLGHSDALVRVDAGLLLHAVEQLVMAVGPWLGAGVLDGLELLTRRTDLDMPPKQALELEQDLMALRALRRAREDERVPQAWVEALRQAWYRGPVVCAQALLGASSALEALDAGAFDHIAHAHPTLLTLYHRARERVTREEAWYAANAPRTDRPRLPGVPLQRGALRFVPSWVFQVLKGVAAAVGLFAYMVFDETFFRASAIYLMTLVLLRVVLSLTWRRISWTPPLPEAALVALAREHVLFPHELVDVLVPDEPEPVGLPSPWKDDQPLLRFERDPLALVRVMTEAHVVRIEQRFAAEATP